MLRQPARRNPAKTPAGSGASLPVPTGGWDAVSPLAEMPPDRAPVLDNWFPKANSIQVRRGYGVHSVTTETQAVESLMVYHGVSSATSKLFAAVHDKIYDASASLAYSTVTTETGLTSARWQYVNFATSAGKYLWCCNGSDAARHYNGSVWAQPAITGITSSDIINVNAHQNRLWFVLANSTKAAYLPTGSVAGAASTFELGGLFNKGGYLVAMATWTRDGGNGPDDYAVFISSRGQCAVYAGTDPASLTTFALLGVYDLGPPLGRRCFTKVGGELVLINIDGVIPLAEALRTDRSAIATIAFTKNINSAMNSAARSYSGSFGWEIIPYPKGTMALLNVPVIEGNTQHQYVMNTTTGAWCRFTGWNANCFALYQENLYFGGNEGSVFRCDNTSLDLDRQVDAIGQTAYNYLKSAGVVKQFNLIQPLVTTDSNVTPALGLSTDFADNAVLETPVSADVSVPYYDIAIYDTDIYPQESRNTSIWSAVPGVGQCASIHFRGRTGVEQGVSLWGYAKWGLSAWSQPITGDVTLAVNGFNMIYERGGPL